MVYVDLDAKAVLEDWDKFSWAEVEAKRRRWDYREPTSSLWESQRGHPRDLPSNSSFGNSLEKESFVEEVDFQTCSLLGNPSQSFDRDFFTRFSSDHIQEGLWQRKLLQIFF